MSTLIFPDNTWFIGRVLIHLLSLAGSPLVKQSVSLVSWLSPWQVLSAVCPLERVCSCPPMPRHGGDTQLVTQMPWSTHWGPVISEHQAGPASPQQHAHAWQPLLEVKWENMGLLLPQDTALALNFTSRTCNLSTRIALCCGNIPKLQLSAQKFTQRESGMQDFFSCCLRAVLITGAQPNTRQP